MGWMCLSVFAQIDGIAFPLLDFFIGGCTLAMGWLSASVGTLFFTPCALSFLPLRRQQAEYDSSFLCSPLLPIFTAEHEVSYRGVFSRIY